MKAHQEVFQCRELNANAGIQSPDIDMPLSKSPIKRIMTNPQPEIKTFDNLAKWFSFQNWELQNHLAWCFTRFADLTD
jgi:hypothetical protein